MIVSDRDAADAGDVFRCLDAADGRELWMVRYPAPGRLDYGSSPRATPLVHDGLVYLYGAFGTLTCVELDSGRIVWRRELGREFPVGEKLAWGLAASPLIVDGRLIVNPGNREASLVALDPATGETRWQSPGKPPAFASFLPVSIAGRVQIIGYDRDSLGGWNPQTGERLWSLVPKRSGDFNVPTPLVVPTAAGLRLVVSSESNGTRSYRFDESGNIAARPEAEHFDLAPDTHTPVVVGTRLFGIWGELFCLDVADGLKEIYHAKDDAFIDYASIMASDDRLLITSQSGELLLVDAHADEFRVLNRLKLFEQDNGVLSHPALVGDRLYVRGSDRIVCLRLQ